MSHRILLFITGPDGQSLAWYPADTAGAKPITGSWADFAHFLTADSPGRVDRAASSGRDDVVVILSGQDCSRLLVPIPSTKRHQALQALPFALEDLAVDEPAQLYAVLGEQPVRPGQWPVLLVDVARRSQVIEQLQALALTARSMVTTADLLPVPPEDHFSVWVEPFTGQGLVLTGPYQGFTLPAMSAESSLVARVGQMVSRLAQKPAGVQFFLSDDSPEMPASTPPADWPQDVTLAFAPAPAASEWLPLWQNGLERNRPLSAVTAPHQVQSQHLRRRWLQAGGAALVLVGLILLWQGVTAWRMGQQVQALQAQITQDFYAALPQGTRLVNAQVQLQQALDRRGGDARQDHFMASMVAFGRVFHPLQQQDASLTITALRFADQQLTVDLSGQQYAALQTLFDQLKASPTVTVKQIDSGVDEGRAHMRLRIESVSSPTSGAS